MKKSLIYAALFSALTGLTSSAFADDTSCTNCFNKRYIYFGGNFVRALLDKDASYAKLMELIERGKAAGYNGIVVNPAGSSSFAYLATGKVNHKDFYTNMYDLVQKAKAANMEIIPVGLSPDSITQINDKMIEAVPVKARPFVVSNGTAVSSATEITTNGSFENGKTDWNLLDDITVDSDVAKTGKASVRFNSAGGKKMMRLYREFTNLQPFTAYRMTFSIKTSNFDAPLKLQIFDKTSENPVYLNSSNMLGLSTTNGQWNAAGNTIDTTQEWKEYNVTFNTLNNGIIRVYLGTWAAGKLNGSAWVDDISIKEVGLAHTIRRESLPLLVQSESGVSTYQEGKDYQVGVEKLTIPGTSSIKNGDTLKVSWYQSGRGMASTWGAPASACTQKYFDDSKKIYNETWKLLDKPNGFLVYFDEWRVMNWDPACGNISAGQYLANTFAKVQKDIYTSNPNAQVYVWNDMFDPYHNAKPIYWMTNGDMSHAADGLDPRTIIMNWNEAAANQVNSLKFFSEKGMQQVLALYYDDKSLAKVETWLANLDKAQADPVKGVTGVNGFMYTTWAGDAGYADLEKVAELIKTRAPQRWPK